MRLLPGVAIRAGTTGDAPFIQRVHEESIRGLGPQAYSRAEAESWAAGLEPQKYVWGMTHGGQTYLVAEAPGKGIVGFCSYNGDRVYALYILPEWAGRGIGSTLLERAEAAIAAAGHDRIRIGAALTSREFYKARGYLEASRGGWRTRGGLVIEALELEKQTESLRLTPAARGSGRH